MPFKYCNHYVRCVLTRLYISIPIQQAANWGLEMFGLTLWLILCKSCILLYVFWKKFVILYSCLFSLMLRLKEDYIGICFYFSNFPFSGVRILNHISCSWSHKYHINFSVGFLFLCLLLEQFYFSPSQLCWRSMEKIAWKISAHLMNVLQSYKHDMFLVIEGKLYKAYQWARIKWLKFII